MCLIYFSTLNVLLTARLWAQPRLFCKHYNIYMFRLKGFPVSDFKHSDGYTKSH